MSLPKNVKPDNHLGLMVKLRDGGYGGLGGIEKRDYCDCCGRSVPALGIDDSEGEYGEVKMCLDCFKAILES